MKAMVQPVSTVAVAVTIAAAITILPTFSDPVGASAPFEFAIATAPVPMSSKCAEQAWPNKDADCVRDSRRSEGVAKPVARTVGTERKAERKTVQTFAPLHAPNLTFANGREGQTGKP
jgi:hypothetical protein